PMLDLIDRDSELVGDLGLTGGVVVSREELVEWWVEQADGHGEAVHRLEDADEVLLLERLELGERGLATRLVVCEDHLPRGYDPVLLRSGLIEEHVLGAAQADPLGAVRPGAGRIVRGVSIGADLQDADLVGPRHQRGEVARDRWRYGWDLADHDVASRAVNRQ